MVVLKHLPLGLAALVAAFGIGVPDTGHAALVTETFTDSYAPPDGALTGNISETLVFQQFDSNLGKLESITVDLAGAGYTILFFNNSNIFPVAYSGASSSGNIRVDALGLSGLLANVTTGILSGTAAPGITSITSSDPLNPQSFPPVSGTIDPATFATYTGNGTATVALAVGPFNITGSYGLPAHLAFTTSFGGDGNISGTVSVTYGYDNSFAVPEPSTLAVFGTGILLLGVMRRQKTAAGGSGDHLLPPSAAA
jgi:hypothetical protein